MSGLDIRTFQKRDTINLDTFVTGISSDANIRNVFEDQNFGIIEYIKHKVLTALPKYDDKEWLHLDFAVCNIRPLLKFHQIGKDWRGCPVFV